RLQTVKIRLLISEIPLFVLSFCLCFTKLMSVQANTTKSFIHLLNSYVMSNMRNKVQLIGRLGIDPEMKNFDNGQMARMSVATTDQYRNAKGEQVEDTQWHNVIAWGKTAEIAGKYLRKGQEVVINGKLETRQYDDKDGNKRYITQVVCNELLMIGKKEA